MSQKLPPRTNITHSQVLAKGDFTYLLYNFDDFVTDYWCTWNLTLHWKILLIWSLQSQTFGTTGQN